MSTLYQTFKTIVEDCEAVQSWSNEEVIARLRCVMSLEADDAAYEDFMEYAEGVSSRGTQGMNIALVGRG